MSKTVKLSIVFLPPIGFCSNNHFSNWRRHLCQFFIQSFQYVKDLFNRFLSADCGTIFCTLPRAVSGVGYVLFCFFSFAFSVGLLSPSAFPFRIAKSRQFSRSRDGRVKMSVFFRTWLTSFILICIQKAATSFDIVAYKRICEFSAKVGLFSLLFHFFRIVEWQFLRRVGEVQRTFVRDNRIPQLLL